MADVKTKIIFEGQAIGVDEAIEKVKKLRDTVAHLGYAVTKTFDPEEIVSIKDRLSSLNKQFDDLAMKLGSDLPAGLRSSYLSYQKHAQATADLYSKSVSLVQAQSQIAHAIMSTNFVIRDAPYFFKDFSLGILAVGNNLNPMIDALLRAKIAAKETNVSFLELVKTSLRGPIGIITGFSLAVAAIQAITFALSQNKKEAEENTKKIQDLVKAYKELETFRVLPAPEELKSIIEERKTKRRELEEKIKSKEEYLARPISTGQLGISVQVSEAESGLKKLREELQQVDKELSAFLKLSDRYNYLTGLSNQLIQERTLNSEKLTEINKLSNNEYKTVIKYLEDEANKLEYNSKQYKELAVLIKQLKDLRKEEKTTTKEVNQELLKLAKNLLDLRKNYAEIFLNTNLNIEQYEQLTKILKELGKNFQIGSKEAERLNQVLSLLKTHTSDINDIMPDLKKREILSESIKKTDEEEFIKKLIEYYNKKREERAQELILTEKTKQELIEINEYFNNLTESKQFQLQLEQWTLKQYQLQADALQTIANTISRITNNQKSTLFYTIQLLRTFLEIAETVNKMGKLPSEGGISTTTGILQILGFASSFAGLFFQNGGIIGGINNKPVPIIAHSGEMILNREQQKNLFKLISTPVIKSSGIKLHIEGQLKAKKNEFIVEFSRNQKIYSRYIDL